MSYMTHMETKMVWKIQDFRDYFQSKKGITIATMIIHHFSWTKLYVLQEDGTSDNHTFIRSISSKIIGSFSSL